MANSHHSIPSGTPMTDGHCWSQSAKWPDCNAREQPIPSSKIPSDANARFWLSGAVTRELKTPIEGGGSVKERRFTSISDELSAGTMCGKFKFDLALAMVSFQARLEFNRSATVCCRLRIARSASLDIVCEARAVAC